MPTVNTNIIKQLTRTFLHDEIVAFPSTSPIELIPTPGPGAMLTYVSCFVVSHIVAPYTNINVSGSGYAVICFGDDDIELSGYLATNSGHAPWKNLLESSFWSKPSPYYSAEGTDTLEWSNMDGHVYGVGQVEDKSMNLVVANGADGNYTGGHVDNTLTVIVEYAEVPI